MFVHRMWVWTIAAAVTLISGVTVVGLESAWEPTDAGISGHIVAVRHAGLALAGLALAAVGHRRLFPLPAVLTTVLPFVFFGHGLDLSGDIDESNYLQAVAEVLLTTAPAAVLAWLQRGHPAANRPSPAATMVGTAAVAAAILSYFISESPYAASHEPWVGQAVAVGLVAALLAPHPRWWWAIVVIPAMLWHEPLAELLYLSRSSYGLALSEYFALAIRATAAGLVVTIVDHSLAVARRRRPPALLPAS